MTAPATTVLTVRVPAEIKERLSALARTTSTSQSTLASEAIAAFVEDQERQLAQIREGIADAEAGRVVEHEDVARWLDSWGTDDELPPPECG